MNANFARFFILSSVLVTVTAAESTSLERQAAKLVPPISIEVEPFEPPPSAFFNVGNKFAAPSPIAAPKFLWPFELRRGADKGTAVVLVHVDMWGYTRALKVLSADNKYFAREAVLGLEHTRWMSGNREVWFYYEAVFDPMKMLVDR